MCTPMYVLCMVEKREELFFKIGALSVFRQPFATHPAERQTFARLVCKLESTVYALFA